MLILFAAEKFIGLNYQRTYRLNRNSQKLNVSMANPEIAIYVEAESYFRLIFGLRDCTIEFGIAKGFGEPNMTKSK